MNITPLVLTSLSLLTAPLALSGAQAPATETSRGDVRCMERVETFVITFAGDLIDAHTDYPASGDPCETKEQGCTFTPPQAATAKSAIEEVVTSILGSANPLCEG